MPNTDLAAQDYLHNADDKTLGCRGQYHEWPKLRPGRILPRGLKIDGPYREGVMELVFTCRSCGMVRRLLTAAQGQLSLPAQYRYTQPEGYKAPKGSGVTKRDCLYETWRRAEEDFKYLLAEQNRVRQLAGLDTTREGQS